MSEIGHNSAGGIAKEQLQSFINRVERLEAERKERADDVKEVYAEAKSSGFDVKALRAIVKLRKQDPAKRREDQAVLDLYLATLGLDFLA